LIIPESVSAATDTLANPDVNSIAAAAANAAPDTLLICMSHSFYEPAAKSLLGYQDLMSGGIITRIEFEPRAQLPPSCSRWCENNAQGTPTPFNSRET
jgi:hypothetical protein